jgi:hypothetical protein
VEIFKLQECCTSVQEDVLIVTPVKLIVCARQERELIIPVLWFVEVDFPDDGFAGRDRNMSKRSLIL